MRRGYIRPALLDRKQFADLLFLSRCLINEFPELLFNFCTPLCDRVLRSFDTMRCGYL